MVVVLIYHIDHEILRGGWIGLDVFFVLSGYLITSLLVGERTRNDRISLKKFYVRRVRRLWPLSWTVLALICVAGLAGVWEPDQQRSLPAGAVAALLQVFNWHQMNHGGYVDAFVAPSPLQHYWSLSLEEQFYLVWPPLLTLLLSLRRRWLVPAVVAAGLVASASAGIWIHSYHRAYLGTDTRIVEILAGVMLAWVLRRRPLEPFAAPMRRVWLVVGGAAVALLIGLCFVLDIERITNATLGFTALSVLSTVCVVGALNLPDMPRVLQPFAFFGRVSFALYLVHWPLLVALGPDTDVWVKWVVGGPVSITIAYALHRLVEQPYLHRTDRPALRWANVSVIGLAVVALVVSVPEGLTPAEQVSASLDQVADPTVPDPTVAAATTPTAPGETTVPTTTAPPCIPVTVAAPAFGGDRKFDPKTIEEIPDPGTTACSDQLVVLIVGDSTGRGVANGIVSLADPRVQVWDRTRIGCSLGDESCPDWRTLWSDAVNTIHPDVVIMNHGVVSDFKGVEDPPFLSEEGEISRQTQLGDAVRMLQAGGAEVYMVSPPNPINPNALFYCKGKRTNSGCDPAWVDRWRASVALVAAQTGAQVLDVKAWVDGRGITLKDRPDGVHFSGAALQENARWLVNELINRTPRR